VLPNTTATDLSTRVSSLMSSSGMASSGYTATTQPSGWATATSGTQITVSISVPYANLRITAGSLVPKPTTLSATVNMIKE
jgi:hypothetical protein